MLQTTATRRVLAAAAILFLLLGAGCVSTQKEAPKQTSLPSDMGSGRVVTGTVVSDELVPVPGATVREAGTSQEAKTDSEGRFRLQNVSASELVLLEARHPAYHNQTLRVDLRFVPSAEVRFVLDPLPTEQPRHETKTTDGEITCQVAFGSHHGFPGFYRRSCAEALPQSKERVQVPVQAGVVAGVIELSWVLQSQFADVMGLTLYLSTKKEEIMIAAVHSLAGDHYVGVYTGTAPVEPAKSDGGVFDAWVHVDPSALDEHVPTNVGIVVQQSFTLYTTAFYGAPPPPTWSALKAK